MLGGRDRLSRPGPGQQAKLLFFLFLGGKSVVLLHKGNSFSLHEALKREGSTLTRSPGFVSVAEWVDHLDAAWRKMAHIAGGHLEVVRQRGSGNQNIGAIVPKPGG